MPAFLNMLRMRTGHNISLGLNTWWAREYVQQLGDIMDQQNESSRYNCSSYDYKHSGQSSLSALHFCRPMDGQPGMTERLVSSALNYWLSHSNYYKYPGENVKIKQRCREQEENQVKKERFLNLVANAVEYFNCACFKGLKTHDRDYQYLYLTCVFRKFLSSDSENLTRDAIFDLNQFRFLKDVPNISLKLCQTVAHVSNLIIPRINQYRAKHLKESEGSEISLLAVKELFSSPSNCGELRGRIEGSSYNYAYHCLSAKVYRNSLPEGLIYYVVVDAVQSWKSDVELYTWYWGKNKTAPKCGEDLVNSTEVNSNRFLMMAAQTTRGVKCSSVVYYAGSSEQEVRIICMFDTKSVDTDVITGTSLFGKKHIDLLAKMNISILECVQEIDLAEDPVTEFSKNGANLNYFSVFVIYLPLSFLKYSI